MSSSDSWKIAEYLESAYPDRPSLFGGEVGHGLSRFVNTLVDRQLIGKLVPSMMLDVLGIVDAEDAAHLRKLERLFKKSLEEMAAQREASVADFRRALDPLRVTLRCAAISLRRRAAYADYIVFSMFQWARIVSRTRIARSRRRAGRLARTHARSVRRHWRAKNRRARKRIKSRRDDGFRKLLARRDAARLDGAQRARRAAIASRCRARTARGAIRSCTGARSVLRRNCARSGSAAATWSRSSFRTSRNSS